MPSLLMRTTWRLIFWIHVYFFSFYNDSCDWPYISVDALFILHYNSV